jgi:hypothetical protein
MIELISAESDNDGIIFAQLLLKHVTMKKLIALFIILPIMFSYCRKTDNDKTADNSKRFLGTWISTDLVDTVEFRTENDLFKNVAVPWDHFNYSVSGDTISIHYNGVLFILVKPTNHYYTFSGNTLTIDLRQCYGFRDQVITFTRK